MFYFLLIVLNFLLSTCQASEADVDVLRAAVIDPDRHTGELPQGFLEAAKKVRRHRRGSFTAEFPEPLQDPGSVGSDRGVKVFADENTVVKGRFGKIPQENGENQVRFLYQTEKGSISGIGAATSLDAPILSGFVRRTQEGESRGALMDWLQWWYGIDVLRFAPDQVTHRVAIARKVNKLTGGVLEAVETHLAPYAGTITPQEAAENGTQPDPIDDEHYASVSRKVAILPTDSYAVIGQMNSYSRVHWTPQKIEALERIIDELGVADVHPNNLVFDTKGNLILLDVEDVKRGNTYSRGMDHKRLEGNLKAMNTTGDEKFAHRTIRAYLWLKKWDIALFATLVALYGRRVWYMSKVNSLVTTISKELFKHKQVEDPVVLVDQILKQEALGERKEQVKPLFVEMVELFKKGKKLGSKSLIKLEKKIRDIWYANYSFRHNIYRGIKNVLRKINAQLGANALSDSQG